MTIEPLLEWLKSNVVGIAILSAIGNYIVVWISKGHSKLGPALSKRLLAPYAIHRVALQDHHDVAGMPLSIYISWHQTRLIAYSGAALLFYVIAFVSGLSSELILINQRIPSEWVAAITILAATVYNAQALSAFLSLRLLYIREVDPLIQGLSSEEKALAIYDPVAFLAKIRAKSKSPEQ